MKKVLNRLFLAAFVMLTAAACDLLGNTEDPVAPSLSFSINDKAVDETTTELLLETGGFYKIAYSLDKGSVEEGEFIAAVEGQDIDNVLIEEIEGQTYGDTLDFTAPAVPGEYELTMQIITADTTVLDRMLTMIVENRDTTVNQFDAVLLAAPLGNYDSETFYSSNRNDKFSINEVNGTGDVISDEIDFGYAFGADSVKATLAGIANYPQFVGSGSYAEKISEWRFKNKTLFRSTAMSAEEFDAVKLYEEEKLAQWYELGTGTKYEGMITNLSAGQVVAFQVRADDANNSKFGLLKVTNIVEGTGENGQIEFTIKIQK